MAIKLYTGLPGAGKSLSLVDELRRMHEKEPGRPVFVHGIPGLREDLGKPFDPTQWEELPDGSICVIDEVQDVWPSGSRTTRPEIRALSKHRHRGFDFVISSQKPAYFDAYLRGLVQQHTHVVRRWFGNSVDRYTWEEGQEDVSRPSIRARAQRSKWKFPRECFDMYKSSSLHTGKRRLPWQYWVMIAAAVLAVPLIGYAVHRIVGLRHLSQDAGTAPAAVSAERSDLMPSLSKERKWATPADYVKDHLPRVANQPWSAPIFDQQAIEAHPDLLCIEYHRVIDGVDQKLCSCYTEQVTPYDLHSLVECRTYARHGVYNPRRVPLDRERFRGEEVAERKDQQKNRAGEVSGRTASDAGPWPRSSSAISTSYVSPELSTISH